MVGQIKVMTTRGINNPSPSERFSKIIKPNLFLLYPRKKLFDEVGYDLIHIFLEVWE